MTKVCSITDVESCDTCLTCPWSDYPLHNSENKYFCQHEKSVGDVTEYGDNIHPDCPLPSLDDVPEGMSEGDFIMEILKKRNSKGMRVIKT